MRYTTLILVITLSLLTIALAQHDHGSEATNESHGHSTEHNTEHTTEHKTEEHVSEEHSTDSHNDHHGTEEHGSEEHGSEEHHNEEHSTEEHDGHHGTEEGSSEHNTDDVHHGHTEDGKENSEEHSEHHATEEHSSEHSNMSESNETSHEHSDHMHHDTTMTDTTMMGTSVNNIMLGDKMLTLYPLLSPQGDFQIMIQSNAAGYTTSTKFEDSNLATRFDDAGITRIDLGKVKQGTYHLTFRDIDSEVTVPVSVYEAMTASGKTFTTIFAPSPSLSSKGQSEVFIYNIVEGENQHQLISVNYSMEGMQHSMDDIVTPLVHEHFDVLKSAVSELDISEENPVLTNAMSNRSALSFAMAGTWQFNIMVDGETLKFDIAMLDQ